MPKRHKFDLKYLIWALGSLGVLSGAIIGTARYLTLPDRVEAVEQTVSKIDEYIQSQQIYNKAVQDILKQNNEPIEEDIIYSEDGRSYWNKEKKKWRPIKELDSE